MSQDFLLHFQTRFLTLLTYFEKWFFSIIDLSLNPFFCENQVQNRPEFGTGSREHKTERIEYEYKNKAPNLGLSATMG